MAEIKSDGKTVGNLPVPHPDEARIRAQNAQRIARRRQAAALALQVQQTAGEDLSRFGERRTIGGRFESLQAVPKRKAEKSTALSLKDLGAFLEGLSFDPSSERLSRQSFLSSFGPGILGLDLTGAD